MTAYQLAEQYLKELISKRTVNPPGDEHLAAAYIAAVLEPEGFRVRLEDVSDGRMNVVASFGEGGTEVLFNGHLDVVPPGEGWRTDPFRPTEEDGKIYGRGACDMKGGIAAMMAAAVAAKRGNGIRNGVVTLAFVAGEEVDGLGARHFVRHHPKAENTYVLIGEPTMMQLAVAHLGVVRFRVDIGGIQCHAAEPEKGLNALAEAGRFLAGIERLSATRCGPDPHGVLPRPLITPTMIQAGEKINVIPDRCTLYLDCRTAPGDSAAKLAADLQRLFAETSSDPRASCTLTTLIESPPGLTPKNSGVFDFVERAAKAASLAQCRPVSMSGSTDMPIFLDNGFPNAAIIGPGGYGRGP